MTQQEKQNLANFMYSLFIQVVPDRTIDETWYFINWFDARGLLEELRDAFEKEKPTTEDQLWTIALRIKRRYEATLTGFTDPCAKNSII